MQAQYVAVLLLCQSVRSYLVLIYFPQEDSFNNESISSYKIIMTHQEVSHHTVFYNDRRIWNNTFSNGEGIVTNILRNIFTRVVSSY